MIWIPAAFLGLAALAAIIVSLARRAAPLGNRAPGAGGAMDVAVVQGLTGKIPAVLRSAPEPAVKADRRANALQGNLAQTPLHDLLQYLALGRKSGILELACGRRTGRIVLEDGRVCKDSYRGKDGLEAMFMMMDLAEGDFEFYEQTPEDSAPFSGLEVVDIIMLWMDRKPKKKA
ncbi:MAG TPA: DUF4388 domain-containing protein [Fibrobacteria bacterium]|nr:DUF4388 domain-containing protein [Fibrobacteria bacterium]